jgi:hypothetical protein
LWSFWYISPVLVCCTKKNLATLTVTTSREKKNAFVHQFRPMKEDDSAFFRSAFSNFVASNLSGAFFKKKVFHPNGVALFLLFLSSILPQIHTNNAF